MKDENDDLRARIAPLEKVVEAVRRQRDNAIMRVGDARADKEAVYAALAALDQKGEQAHTKWSAIKAERGVGGKQK